MNTTFELRRPPGVVPRSIACAGGALLALLLATGCTSTPAHPAGRHERTMANEVAGQQLGYLMHVPEAREMPESGWPLLLFLHGAGERGTDLARVEVHGPPKLVAEIPQLAACVLVAPQCPSDQWWQSGTLVALLEEVRGAVRIDAARIYVSGLSMGAYGTWSLLADEPDLFAAAVPICGGAGRGFDVDRLLLAKNVPIRVFHGDADQIVPVEESRKLVRALEAVGGRVELTEYPGVGHDSWSVPYADPALYAWIFAQHRGGAR